MLCWLLDFLIFHEALYTYWLSSYQPLIYKSIYINNSQAKKGFPLLVEGHASSQAKKMQMKQLRTSNTTSQHCWYCNKLTNIRLYYNGPEMCGIFWKHYNLSNCYTIWLNVWYFWTSLVYLYGIWIFWIFMIVVCVRTTYFNWFPEYFYKLDFVFPFLLKVVCSLFLEFLTYIFFGCLHSYIICFVVCYLSFAFVTVICTFDVYGIAN